MKREKSNFWAGVGSVVIVMPNPEPSALVHITKNFPESNSDALRSDMMKIGEDFSKAVDWFANEWPQKLPDKQPNPSGSVVMHESVTKIQFKGPLPSPEVLREYNTIVPNAAERILKLAEDEATHRRKLEIEVVEGGIKDDKRRAWERKAGQIFALIIGLGTVIYGTYAAVMGQPWAGGFIGSSGVTGLVVAFIYGSKRQPTEVESPRSVVPRPQRR